MRREDHTRETAQPYAVSPKAGVVPQPGDTRPMGDGRVRLTYEDYRNAPAGLRYELIEGDLRMMPSPNTLHQEVSKRLGSLLLTLERQGMGKTYSAPYDVVLSQHNVLQPDLLFVVKNRVGIIGKANIRGAPDLVIEILSSKEPWDRKTKRQVYARYGVRELWLVDPKAKTIEVASLRPTGRLAGGQDLVTTGVYSPGTTARGAVLPDLVVDVAALFEDAD